MPDGGGDIDPIDWIRYVGMPLAKDVEGLKRTMIWASGAAAGFGVALGVFAPYILRKLGLA